MSAARAGCGRARRGAGGRDAGGAGRPAWGGAGLATALDSLGMVSAERS